MPKLIEKKEVEGRVLELREFNDVFVVYERPTERKSGAGRVKKLGEFKDAALAREFMSKPDFFSDSAHDTEDVADIQVFHAGMDIKT